MASISLAAVAVIGFAAGESLVCIIVAVVQVELVDGDRNPRRTFESSAFARGHACCR